MLEAGPLAHQSQQRVAHGLVLLVEVFRGPDNRAATFWAAAMSVMVVLAELAMWFPQSTTLAFHGTYRVDVMSAVLKAFLMVIVLLSFFYARDYFERRPFKFDGKIGRVQVSLK